MKKLVIFILSTMAASNSKLAAQNIYSKNVIEFEQYLTFCYNYDSIYPFMLAQVFDSKKIKKDQKLVKYLDTIFKNSTTVLRKKEIKKALGKSYHIEESEDYDYFLISISGAYIYANMIYDSSGTFSISYYCPYREIYYFNDGECINYIYPIIYLLPFVTNKVFIGDKSVMCFFSMYRNYKYIPFNLLKKGHSPKKDLQF